jgi:hypothetical protein
MPLDQKQASVERPWSGPCPTCGYKFMTRTTKDANSEFQGWIKCANPNGSCTYAADFYDFREIQRAAKTP